MKVVLAIAFFLAASWMPEIEAMTSCQRGWRLFFKEKMCYKYFPGNRSYYSARKLCKQQGGYKKLLSLLTLEGTITLPLSLPTKIFGLVDEECMVGGHGMMARHGLIHTGDQMNQII